MNDILKNGNIAELYSMSYGSFFGFVYILAVKNCSLDVVVKLGFNILGRLVKEGQN